MAGGGGDRRGCRARASSAGVVRRRTAAAGARAYAVAVAFAFAQQCRATRRGYRGGRARRRRRSFAAAAYRLHQTVGARKIPDRQSAQHRVHTAQTRKRPNFGRKAHYSPSRECPPTKMSTGACRLLFAVVVGRIDRRIDGNPFALRADSNAARWRVERKPVVRIGVSCTAIIMATLRQRTVTWCYRNRIPLAPALRSAA